MSDTHTEASESSKLALPEDVLPVLPMRNLVLFPGVVLPIGIGRAQSVAAAQEAIRHERPVALLLQKDSENEAPGPDDLYPVGTIASILRYVTTGDGGHHLIAQGEGRFRVREFLPDYPFLAARIERLEETTSTGSELDARVLHLRQQAGEALSLLPQVPQELAQAIAHVEQPGALADLVANFLDLKAEERQQILENLDVRSRLEQVSQFLSYRIEVMKLSQKIGEQTKEVMDRRQREYLLREQLKAIQQELGEGEEGNGELEALGHAIDEAQLPAEVEAVARKELRRLQRMPEGAGEYGMVQSYIDAILALPWGKETPERIDIGEARGILDEDHYDLDKIKRRILEHLAVHRLNPNGKSPILCFVGPPGVGKTSLGQSIARAMGRKFVRVSLGGVHDEAEIRGHRRTYIGALPGNILQALGKVEVRNPVMLLDEIDKLGAGGFHGDPAAALLEVLDPEQNRTFRDTYLAMPFDLSHVFFIATANVLDTIPGPLRDRMEIIALSGYTEEDKMHIASRYLLPRQREAAGLTAEQLVLEDDTLLALIRGYTREAGCRSLERELGAICRWVAVRIAEGSSSGMQIRPDDLATILGPQHFENEVASRVALPGVATGLAWTPVGGDILFIEASKSPGNGRLILTGQLGDVMKESAQAAMSLVKARAADWQIAQESIDKSDIHIHIPAGAIPKDGPSAGVTLAVALISLLTGRKVRPDVAMTGEISLRGLVLPVGGVKEKVLAALRAGIHTVLLPARNRRDYEEIPENARQQLTFIWIERVEEAVAQALEGGERSGESEAGSL
ncbi:MAG: endopeptidase La [Acidithiobacillus sp.]